MKNQAGSTEGVERLEMGHPEDDRVAIRRLPNQSGSHHHLKATRKGGFFCPLRMPMPRFESLHEFSRPPQSNFRQRCFALDASGDVAVVNAMRRKVFG
jgi:hypothetical protein